MDVFNLPSLDLNNRIFYANGNSWQIWNKPKNVKFIHILILGGGGGGGSGRTSVINSATGGGGGGSSSITKAIYPSSLFPERIYIQVGQGGLGGAVGFAGNSGGITYLTAQPNTTSQNILMQSSDTGAGGGGTGSSTVAGTFGTGATVWTFGNFIFGNLGIIESIAGSDGVSGGGIGGTTPSLTLTLPVSGGAGGGAVSGGNVGFTAGSITGSTLIPIPNSTASDLNSASKGGNGYFYLPNILNSYKIGMFFMGGAGGGSATSGNNGGAGGNGAYGCGGGGGGGAYSGTGGAGGNGGDGLVMINCW